MSVIFLVSVLMHGSTVAEEPLCKKRRVAQVDAGSDGTAGYDDTEQAIASFQTLWFALCNYCAYYDISFHNEPWYQQALYVSQCLYEAPVMYKSDIANVCGPELLLAMGQFYGDITRPYNVVQSRRSFEYDGT